MRKQLAKLWSHLRNDEQELDLDVISELLGRPPRVILEVGANDGSDSMRLLSAFPLAELHCFEPDPRAIEKWKSKVRDPRARLHSCAIGAGDGTATFHQSSGDPAGRMDNDDQGWDKSGSIRRPTGHLAAHSWCKFESQLQVELRSLDSWARQYGVEEVDFVWADVQGAEADLIEGGQALLRRTRLLYTEVSDVPLYEGQIGLSELLSRLSGWKIIRRFPNDVLLLNSNLKYE